MFHYFLAQNCLGSLNEEGERIRRRINCKAVEVAKIVTFHRIYNTHLFQCKKKKTLKIMSHKTYGIFDGTFCQTVSNCFQKQ